VLESFIESMTDAVFCFIKGHQSFDRLTLPRISFFTRSNVSYFEQYFFISASCFHILCFSHSSFKLLRVLEEKISLNFD